MIGGFLNIDDDTKVTQEVITGSEDENYPILAAGSADSETKKEVVKKVPQTTVNSKTGEMKTPGMSISGDIKDPRPADENTHKIFGTINVRTGHSVDPEGNIDLGSSSNPWQAIFSLTDAVQTSDERFKKNITYVEEAGKAKAARILSSESEKITTDDILDFVRDIMPATFDYDVGNGELAARQIGLIFGDIEGKKLSPYIGTTSQTENGESIGGLRILPLTVAALAVCKHLLTEVDALRSRMEDLEA